MYFFPIIYKYFVIIFYSFEVSVPFLTVNINYDTGTFNGF